VPTDQWHEVAEALGVRQKVEGPGYESSKRMLDKTLAHAARMGDAFSDQEIELLGRHLLATEIEPTVITRLQDKVVRHVRGALRDDLSAGGPTSKIGMLAKWPSQWLSDYQAAVEGNCPTVFAGVIQNAFAPDGRLWKP